MQAMIMSLEGESKEVSIHVLIGSCNFSFHLENHSDQAGYKSFPSFFLSDQHFNQHETKNERERSYE